MKNLAFSLTPLRVLGVATAILVIVTGLTPSVQAQTYATIHSFAGFDQGDGAEPQASMILDGSGNLYGTTFYGGAFACGNGCGTVFELTPVSGGWQETVLHEFTGKNGSLPWASLVSDGTNLYGTTWQGGTLSDCGGNGCGVVFKLSPSSTGWHETVLHIFSGGKDGANPRAGLILDASGNLYGTTSQGGIAADCGGNGCGVVFELSPFSGGGWAEKELHSFTGGSDGAQPWAGLIFDTDGNLYGTTSAGGSSGTGVVFELKPASGGGWKEAVLHTFSSVAKGLTPAAGVIFDPHGNLYGTTSGGGITTGDCSPTGCGVVFKLSPDVSTGGWAETVIHVFQGTRDGAFPDAGVILDSAGNLYGTTQQGGLLTGGCDANRCGVVFEFSPTATGWKETVLHDFIGTSADGALPEAGLVLDSTTGNLYGTTTEDGTSGGNGSGTAFEITP
ncbi:MAG TPA: choice-of-anchor tandem repeat GloVer-containing protein [Candidatus Eremiobacteraceae bacterium]|nr:choice-of-anchor tandem repeat GloVer-containing protein [Candidatus Eremiobacteraceae bacterium]